MQKNDWSAWTLIFGATLTGAISTAMLVGCKPPATQDAVDISTELDIDPGVAVSSNTTSNTTTGAETPTAETPAGNDEPQEKKTAEPKSGDTSRVTPEAATTLVASQSTDKASLAPEKIVSAGGDWPQWGGTRLRNNTPNVTGLPQVWDIGKFDRKTVSGTKPRQRIFAGMPTWGAKPTAILL